MSDFFIFKCDEKEILRKRGLTPRGEVQQYIDSECLMLCKPFVPKDTGNLIQSGNIETQIGSGEVRYRTPYARRWYYRPASFYEAPMRGNYWFERMKQQYKQQILAGAKKIAGGK